MRATLWGEVTKLSLAGPPLAVDSAVGVNLLVMALLTQLHTPKVELWLPDPNTYRDVDGWS